MEICFFSVSDSELHHPSFLAVFMVFCAADGELVLISLGPPLDADAGFRWSFLLVSPTSDRSPVSPTTLLSPGCLRRTTSPASDRFAACAASAFAVAAGLFPARVTFFGVMDSCRAASRARSVAFCFLSLMEPFSS